MVDITPKIIGESITLIHVECEAEEQEQQIQANPLQFYPAWVVHQWGREMDFSKLEESIREATWLLPTFRENEDLIAIFDHDNIITLSYLFDSK